MSSDCSNPPEENDQSPKTDTPGPLRSVFQNHLLHKYEWRPEGNIKSILHICHGIHEYMGRYEALAEFLKDNGILVRAIDLVGHGRSEGDRGHVDSLDTYITDVINHIQQTKDEYNNLPLFLMGHSNGGAVAIGITLRIQEQLAGLILSAPGIIADDVSVILKGAVKVLAAVFPQVGVRGLDDSTISSVPEEVEMYNNDPLVYRGKLKASWAAAIFRAIDEFTVRLNEIVLPLLLIHGTDDTLVPIAASILVNDNVTSVDKTFERFEGSRHETLHDKDQERVRQLICQWIQDHKNDKEGEGSGCTADDGPGDDGNKQQESEQVEAEQ